MKNIFTTIEYAQNAFKQKLEEVNRSGGLTLDRYVRYLSMQHHLTNGVQRHFMIAASHPDLVHHKSLRKFLVNFADEEELHYEIALRDLINLKQEVLPAPFDVKLWRAYFDRHVYERPFLRLGATCILENISTKSSGIIGELFAKADFINPRNSRFFKIHQHEDLPHGDQILKILSDANLNDMQLKELEEGARHGFILYMRMANWALDVDAIDAVI